MILACVGSKLRKIAAQRFACNLGERPRELNPRGAPSDHDEGEPLVAPSWIDLSLGRLESQEDALAHFQGILDGLEAGGVVFPVVVPEIRVRRPGR